MRFRPAALRQLEAPEKLDEVVRLATAPVWLIATALAFVIAAAAAWASVGTVATTVAAAGVLIHANGVSTVDATVSGQVTEVQKIPAGFVAAGTTLLRVRGAHGRGQLVDLPWNADAVSMLVSLGERVGPGTPVASAQRVSRASDPLEAVVFLPAAMALAVRPGHHATLTAAAVPASVFGTLSGTVTSVGETPETASSLRAFLGGGVDSQSYLGAGSVIRVLIRLSTVPGSPAALRWSKASPGFMVSAESSVSASFVLATEHPMSWLIGG